MHFSQVKYTLLVLITFDYRKWSIVPWKRLSLRRHSAFWLLSPFSTYIWILFIFTPISLESQIDQNVSRLKHFFCCQNTLCLEAVMLLSFGYTHQLPWVCQYQPSKSEERSSCDWSMLEYGGKFHCKLLQDPKGVQEESEPRVPD